MFPNRWIRAIPINRDRYKYTVTSGGVSYDRRNYSHRIPALSAVPTSDKARMAWCIINGTTPPDLFVQLFFFGVDARIRGEEVDLAEGIVGNAL